MSWQEVLLSLINLVTSTISGIAGMGGGMILAGLMPLFLPAAAIIPVHGTTQLSSNISRAWFGRDRLDLAYLPAYIIGSIGGAIVFAVLVRFISLEFVPPMIALYILLTQWFKPINHWLKNRESFYVIGFLQTGIGMFVGSPGPLHMPLLMKKYADAHTAVTTGSLMVTFLHILKLIVYAWLGFSFAQYWQLILLLTVSATIGSWLGVRLRHYVPNAWLRRAIPWVMTVIAIKILIVTAAKYGILPF